MIELKPKEKKTLQNILKANEHINSGDSNLRNSLLEDCGVEKVCNDIKLDYPTNSFVSVLCNQLQKIGLKKETKPALIIFLENYKLFFSDDLYPHQIDFIDSVIARWNQPESPPEPSGKTRKIKFDKDIISQYNLEDMIAAFHKGFQDEEGVFSFSMGADSADYDIMRNYFIERLIKEHKIKRECEIKCCDVFVSDNDLSDESQTLIKKLEDMLNCDKVDDWFRDNPDQDLMVLIWNYSIPYNDFKNIAELFWNQTLKTLSQSLENTNRCFVVIWLSELDSALDLETKHFTVLPIPEKVDTKRVKKWFREKLKKSGLDDITIQRKLKLLEGHGGKLRPVYSQMKAILSVF